MHVEEGTFTRAPVTIYHHRTDQLTIPNIQIQNCHHKFTREDIFLPRRQAKKQHGASQKKTEENRDKKYAVEDTLNLSLECRSIKDLKNILYKKKTGRHKKKNYTVAALVALLANSTRQFDTKKLQKTKQGRREINMKDIKKTAGRNDIRTDTKK